MNNLLSYFGLVDTRIRASDKDLPVRAYEPGRNSAQPKNISAYLIIWCGNYFFDMSKAELLQLKTHPYGICMRNFIKKKVGN